MKITIIDGSLQDYVDNSIIWALSIDEPCTNTAFDIVEKFLGYGKTVVLEPVSECEE